MHNLSGKQIAILVTDGFEEEELTRPRDALDGSGAETFVVAPTAGTVRAWDHTDWGGEYHVDLDLDDASAADFDALLLPGGVRNPDQLRKNSTATTFVRAFFQEHKPVVAICHAPWTLIDAGVVKGRRMTSYASVRTDLIHAGAEWVDEEVVEDRGLVTSRNPRDIRAFNRKILEVFQAGKIPTQGPGEGTPRDAHIPKQKEPAPREQ